MLGPSIPRQSRAVGLHHSITAREASKERNRSPGRKGDHCWQTADCYCTFVRHTGLGGPNADALPLTRLAAAPTPRGGTRMHIGNLFFLFLLLEGGGSCMQAGPRPGRCITTLSLALRDVYLDFPLGQSGRFFLWLEKLSTFFFFLQFHPTFHVLIF